MIKAYYELSKPGIIYGNILTAVAGYLLACRLHLHFSSFGGMVAGFMLVIGSACAFNNLADRDIDAKMTRTKNRPSVNGQISTKAGLVYASILAVTGFCLLFSLANPLTALIAAIGFIVYTTAYTYSKRKTHHSTLIGSISGATPIVGGYVAFSGHLDVAAIIIGIMMILWQMPHFYAIAIYRDEDYRRAGIPSLPVIAGKKTTGNYMVVYSLLFAIACILLYRYSNVGLTYLIVMLVVSTFWLGLNIAGLFTKTIEIWAKKSFHSSLIVMLVMSMAISFR